MQIKNAQYEISERFSIKFSVFIRFLFLFLKQKYLLSAPKCGAVNFYLTFYKLGVIEIIPRLLLFKQDILSAISETLKAVIALLVLLWNSGKFRVDSIHEHQTGRIDTQFFQ